VERLNENSAVHVNIFIANKANEAANSNLLISLANKSSFKTTALLRLPKVQETIPEMYLIR
jgi:hypothetical protein